MATPTPEMIGVYYASKYSDTDRTVGSGSTLMNIIATNITEPSGSWDGAVGYFIGPSTAALRGITFHVKSWDKSENRLTLAQPLPTPPVSGDKFKLFVGGQSATTTDVLCMKVSGKQPEVETVTGSNVTGITIKKVSPMLGEGTLEIYYNYTNKSLKIRMGSSDYGPEVSFTGNATNAVLYNRDLAGYVVLDVVYASLPGSVYRNDTFTLTFPKGNMIPNYQGYETNDGIGRTRYHLFVVRNKCDSLLDAMTALSFWTGKPAGTPTTCPYSYSPSYTAPQAITVNNASDWPTRGFWVRNKTRNDLRYVDYRSGNTLYAKPILWGVIAFKNAQSQIVPGMTLGNNSSSSPGTTAIVDQVFLESGSWTDKTASGTLHLKKYTGSSSFGFSSSIYSDGTILFTGNGTSTRGFRGCTAVTWTGTDVIEPASDIDIGVDFPVGSVYQDPVNENTAPAGVTFGYYGAQDSALIIEALLGGESVGLWTRETILDGTQARENIEGDIHMEWF